MTDDFLQERTQAPLDKMKDWVNYIGTPLVSALQDRIGVVRAGKRMLDEGGEAAELDMLAKKVALDAVALDEEVSDKIQRAVDLYKDASALIRRQRNSLGALGGLAESYDHRARTLSQLLEQLGDAPANPP